MRNCGAFELAAAVTLGVVAAPPAQAHTDRAAAVSFRTYAKRFPSQRYAQCISIAYRNCTPAYLNGSHLGRNKDVIPVGLTLVRLRPGRGWLGRTSPGCVFKPAARRIRYSLGTGERGTWTKLPRVAAKRFNRLCEPPV